ncbi:hypothetical protein ABPG77_001091 [Micractinium sp. CCAP 211/92]
MADLSRDTKEAMHSLCRHVALDPGCAQGAGAGLVQELVPLQAPWGPLGQQASLGRLPFLVQHQLPTHAFVDAFMTNVQVTPDDVREVFPSVLPPSLGAPAGQPFAPPGTPGSPEPETAAASGGSTQSCSDNWEQPLGGPAPRRAASESALEALPSFDTAGHASAYEPEESLASDSDLDQPFVGRGSEASEMPESPSSATRSLSNYESGWSGGGEVDAAVQLEAADHLAQLLRRQLASR